MQSKSDLPCPFLARKRFYGTITHIFIGVSPDVDSEVRIWVPVVYLGDVPKNHGREVKHETWKGGEPVQGMWWRWYHCRHVCLLSRSVMSESLRPRTIAHQAPLSMGFSSQEYECGWPFPTLGDLPDPGIEPTSVSSPALVGGFLITCATCRGELKSPTPEARGRGYSHTSAAGLGLGLLLVGGVVSIPDISVRAAALTGRAVLARRTALQRERQWPASEVRSAGT